MMASQVLRVLEKRTLVSRSADPADARVRLVRLTVEGQQLATSALDAVEAVDAGFFARADGSLLATLRALDDVDED